MWIFACAGVCAPNPGVVPGSTVFSKVITMCCQGGQTWGGLSFIQLCGSVKHADATSSSTHIHERARLMTDLSWHYSPASDAAPGICAVSARASGRPAPPPPRGVVPPPRCPPSSAASKTDYWHGQYSFSRGCPAQFPAGPERPRWALAADLDPTVSTTPWPGTQDLLLPCRPLVTSPTKNLRYSQQNLPSR